ncbi:Msm1 [Kluyveromyces lactis]|nr:Msm1 [Kluyveromyces lactis]
MASKAVRAVSKFHITTPIFYPNAKPHLGHLYCSLLCDVQNRWKKLAGQDTCFTTGVDEHGLKIQLAAQQKGYSNPKAFVDELCEHFVHLDKDANIKFTRFIRTTDPDHVNNVKKLWNLCYDNGYIYKGEHKGWYSVSDETFYPDTKILKLTINGPPIPYDGNFDPDAKYINSESRNEVTYQSELNYFFKLSAFQEPLIKLLRENPTFIYPPLRHSQILRELESNELRDISVSRPATRLQWGIPVPEDESQKVYVWFDALCNYLTSIGGIDAIRNDVDSTQVLHNNRSIIEKPKEWWENTEHVIGKDIIRFHTVYWPAFLLAAKLPLPNRVVVHGHWLSGGVKMSKSLGNVVDPIQIISYYGADTTRWYLLENSNIESDGNFIEKNLWETRELLCSKLGNLINRCGGKKFSLASGVELFSGKPIEELSSVFPKESQAVFTSLLKSLDNCTESVNNCFQQYDITGAQKIIWNIINEANSFIQSTEPWSKKGLEKDLIVYSAMEAARISLIISQPIIPNIAERLLNRLDVSSDRRTLSYTSYGSDDSYGMTTNQRHKEVPIQRVQFRLHNE